MFEFEGNTYTLEQMLTANAHDIDFCTWARNAAMGEWFLDCQYLGTEREAL